MGFTGHESWSGLPTQGSSPGLLHGQADSLPRELMPNSQSRKLTFLTALVTGPELGMRKCCRLVDIARNYNLTALGLTDTAIHSFYEAVN